MIERELQRAILAHWNSNAITDALAGLDGVTLQSALGELYPGGEDAAPTAQQLPRNAYALQIASPESSGTLSDHEVYPVMFQLWAAGADEAADRLGKVRAAFNESNSQAIAFAAGASTLDIVEYQSSEVAKVDSHVHVGRLLLNFRVNRQH